MSSRFLLPFAVALMLGIVVAPGRTWGQYQRVREVEQLGQFVSPQPQHQLLGPIPQTAFPLPALCPQGNCGSYSSFAPIFPGGSYQPAAQLRPPLLELQRGRMVYRGRR
jgi:hypothetical protein